MTTVSDNSNNNNNNSGEQQFTIQPHPAKDNVPPSRFKGDDAEQTPGLGGAPTLGHLHQQDPTGGKQPYVPSQDLANNLEKPLSREELQAKQQQLNE
ncbi:hypothetical protein OIO90_001494 [Microbotryomycetes sp. JL221]|nr:hypothetical protein OIO90_001494 [Microbotryomycetes sp. JL221]